MTHFYLQGSVNPFPAYVQDVHTGQQVLGIRIVNSPPYLCLHRTPKILTHFVSAVFWQVGQTPTSSSPSSSI
jgi:hypothetical protein